MDADDVFLGKKVLLRCVIHANLVQCMQAHRPRLFQ